MLRELRQEMFSEMVEAKDISQAGKFDDPGFLLYTNGQVQDDAAFCAGHARVYPTEISYAVEYDDGVGRRPQTGSAAGCGSPRNVPARTPPASR
jgi:hypothetical protein